MKVVPLGEKVVVRRLDAAETSAGGVLLPSAFQQKSEQGRVLSVGDGRLLTNGRRAAHTVNEGDRILFSNETGTEVLVDGEELLILDEEDILAVVR